MEPSGWEFTDQGDANRNERDALRKKNQRLEEKVYPVAQVNVVSSIFGFRV
jgi:hypothetical protein